MEEIIKQILYYVSLSTGSIMLICLLIAGAIRCICIMLDHLRIANVMREALMLYIKTKRPDLKLKDVDIKKSRYIK